MRSMLYLLFYDDKELSDSDVSEDDDGRGASYVIDSPVNATELFSLIEVVSETPVVKLASASLHSSAVSATLDSPELDGELTIRMIVGVKYC